MKKLAILLTGLLLLNCSAFAKDTLQFDFPNAGWHKVMSPDGVASKKCYVPYSQSSESFTEMIIFSERVLKHADISALSYIQKQIGKDRNNYKDIIPEYMVQDMDNAMVTWCSQLHNTCAVERVFKGNQGIVTAIYLNKAPHYSQNMFGQWSNILSNVKVYNGEAPADNLIELD